MIKDKIDNIFRTMFSYKGELSDSLSAEDVREWDSLKHVMFMAAIEKEFQIKFDITDMLSMKTLSQIYQKVD